MLGHAIAYDYGEGAGGAVAVFGVVYLLKDMCSVGVFLPKWWRLRLDSSLRLFFFSRASPGPPGPLLGPLVGSSPPLCLSPPLQGLLVGSPPLLGVPFRPSQIRGKWALYSFKPPAR